MALDRTNYNALVDDDGSGTTGSIWSKTAIKDVILDPADSAYALNLQTTTGTGNQADFNLSTKVTWLRCTGAAPAFGGFQINGVAPASGDRVVIECLGTTAKVYHEETGFESVAANRIICPSTNGQIVGVNGRIELIYDGTSSRWRAQCIDPGAPIDVTFNAADYTGSGSMTWTVASGDVEMFRYQQMGRRLRIEMMLFTTTVGGTVSTTLQAKVPGGFTPSLNASSRRPFTATYVSNNGTDEAGRVSASATNIEFVRLPPNNWTASTENTRVSFDGIITVN